MNNICFYKAYKSIDSVESFRMAAGDGLHVNTVSILLHRERFFKHCPPLSLCILFYLCFSWTLQICQILSGKTNLNGGTLAKRSQGFLRCQACSMQRVFNREWKLDNGNCRPLLHKPCVHVWGWEQDIWVMENNTDALSFICSSVCRCFRVWVFFYRIETILTQIVECNSMQQFT